MNEATATSSGTNPQAARLEPLFASRPELWTRFQTFHDSLWTSGHISRRVLELCRLRMAAIHDCAGEWNFRTSDVFLSEPETAALRCGDFSAFDHCERAALELTEKLPFQHHDITDMEVKAVEDGYGSAATVALLTAIAFFDVRCRWQRVLIPPAAT
jgi:alkylhydroperoxidase family enzyme